MKHTDTIYIDIETIPSQEPWVREYIAKKTTPPANIKLPASIDKWYKEKHAEAVEFAMEKCSFDGAMNNIIAIGVAINDNDPFCFMDNEKDMLINFYKLMDSRAFPTFVGHNISGFDMRVIRQRSIINGVKPAFCMPFDAKPWDKNPFDTMVQWDPKNMTGIDKIARAFGIEGKNEVDGSMVYQMWKDGKLKEIADYCCDDVRMVRDVYKKMKMVL